MGGGDSNGTGRGRGAPPGSVEQVPASAAPDLAYVLYRSRAVISTRSVEMARIYLGSRRRNHREEIGGVLHREEGHFVEYIEGRQAAIDGLIADIRRDWRHDVFTLLAGGHLDAPAFPGWSMTLTMTDDVDRAGWTQVGESDISVTTADVEKLMRFLKHLSHTATDVE